MRGSRVGSSSFYEQYDKKFERHKAYIINIKVAHSNRTVTMHARSCPACTLCRLASRNGAYGHHWKCLWRYSCTAGAAAERPAAALPTELPHPVVCRCHLRRLLRLCCLGEAMSGRSLLFAIFSILKPSCGTVTLRLLCLTCCILTCSQQSVLSDRPQVTRQPPGTYSVRGHFLRVAPVFAWPPAAWAVHVCIMYLVGWKARRDAARLKRAQDRMRQMLTDLKASTWSHPAAGGWKHHTTAQCARQSHRLMCRWQGMPGCASWQ